MAAARSPPASAPANVQLRRPKVIGRMARSAAELSMQARPAVPSRSVWKFGLASPPMMRISGQAARSMH